MSTKSTIFCCGDETGDHELQIHIFRDMHQADKTVVVELWCSTCYCNYTFLMDEHLGKQLAERLKGKDK